MHDLTFEHMLGTVSELHQRGLGKIIDEYRSKSTSGERKSEILAFLGRCLPPSEEEDRGAWHLRLANLEDLSRENRISTLVKSSGGNLVNFQNEVVDTDLLLIDLRNSCIFSNQYVVARHGLLIAGDIRHMDPEWYSKGTLGRTQISSIKNINPIDRTATLQLPPGAVKLPSRNTYFLFHGLIGTTSFAHFIFDFMSQIIAFDHLRRIHGDRLVPVVATEHWFLFKWPGMAWLYEQLIGSPADIVHLESNCYATVEAAYTTNRVVLGDKGISFEAIRYLYRKIHQICKPTDDAALTKKIYISRDDAGDRQSNNIADVEALLARFGFTKIVIEKLSPQEAFDHLYHAETIVGMHGSGLIYQFYAKPGATVIELSYPGIDWQILVNLATLIGHKGHYIENDNGTTDLRQLESVLENQLPT